MRFACIAVATDFSAGADLAFASALELAVQHGARLLVVHVIPPLITPTPLLDAMVVSEMSLQLRENLYDSAQREMNQRYLAQAGKVPCEAVIRDGDPSRELASLIQERGVDLLVVGSTGLSGLAGVFFGSVAAKAVRRASCSVLVVRPAPGGDRAPA